MRPKRFMPCSLVRRKSDKSLHIVNGDYTYLCSGHSNVCEFEPLNLFHLNENGEIYNGSAWHDINDFELVQLPTQELFDKITRFQQKVYNGIE